jgi:heat shock protein HslJ
MTLSSFLKKAGALACTLSVLAACASGIPTAQPSAATTDAGVPAADATESAPDFSRVYGRVWQLAEVRGDSGALVFDRQKLDTERFGDSYTLQFDDERAGGKASPNRYNAPYTLGSGDALSFAAVAGTLMMGLAEPEGLNEQGYYTLLGNASRWRLAEERLLLYTVNSEGAALTMVFQEFEYR